MCSQDVDLGVGEVIFVQVGDILKQLQALGVIEQERGE